MPAFEKLRSNTRSRSRRAEFRIDFSRSAKRFFFARRPKQYNQQHSDSSKATCQYACIPDPTAIDASLSRQTPRKALAIRRHQHFPSQGYLRPSHRCRQIVRREREGRPRHLVRPHLGKRDVASQPVADPDCETDRTSQGLERLAAKTEAHAPQQPSIGQT